jgi:aspartate/methionine/tyrosine aminotransferase
MIREFRARRELIVSGLNALPGVTAPMPTGAFYAFPDVSGTGLSGRTFADRMLNEAGVSLLSGTAFGQQGANSLRVSYANSQEKLRQALTRMGDFLAAG